jgi:hypothetical protein
MGGCVRTVLGRGWKKLKSLEIRLDAGSLPIAGTASLIAASEFDIWS